MFNNAKNCKLKIDDTYVQYITFGKGSKNLIILPGVGDGFKTVKGTAIPFSILYKKYAKDYKVYVFSRRDKLEDNFSVDDMANDIISHMKQLNINKTSIIGVSQGGMIAQSVALKAPELIEKLVLVVTTSRSNDILNDSINRWILQAKNRDYKGIMISTAEKSYTGKYLEKSKKIYKFLSLFGKNATYDRFIIEAKACLGHNVYDRLNNITCPTLVIGGRKDKVLGCDASVEISNQINNSELYIYEEYSHGLYEQAKDFNDRVLNFLNK